MSKRNQFFITLALIAFVIVMRLAPHPANVAPVAAVALFAGAYLSRRLALAVPLVAMFMSDLVIGFYEPTIMLAVYGSFAFSVLLGLWVRRQRDAMRILTASLAGSLVFFFVTNFAVWVVGSWYPHTFQGLLLNYTLALPFFRNTLLGDLFFAGAFFGVAELLRFNLSKKIAAGTASRHSLSCG